MKAIRETVSIPMVGLLLLAALAPPVRADPTKAGPEIVVTAGEGYVENPRIAADPAGNFLVVWQDGDDGTVKGRGFHATGNDQGPTFQMSDAELYVGEGNFDSDELLSVASDAAGNFVVAFNAYDTEAEYLQACYGSPCIYTKRRDANGNLAPATFIVGDPRLNAYRGENYNQTANPEIAGDGDGNFIVAWEGYDQVYHIDHFDIDEGVWARKLVNSGQINGGQFLVNEVKFGYQGDGGQLDIAADDAGNFVVVWQDENYEYPPYSGIVMRRFDKFKNPIGSQEAVTPSLDRDPHVAVTGAGETMVVWSSFGILNGRVYDDLGAAVGPEFVVGSGETPEMSAAGPAAFVVVYDGPSGVAGRLFDTSGSPLGDEFDVTEDGYSPAVAGDGEGNFVVAWQVDDEVHAQRFQVVPPTPKEIPLLGKVLVLKNKIPDDFEKSNGKWKASGAAIEVPLRGSASDPRCNGDPPGTVKASVRFSSATSGEDTGAIPLPCRNWTATGANTVSAVAKRGFKYSDGQRLDGPCNSIKITGTKSLSVSCKGKPGVAAFEYDLVAGVGQGAIVGALTLGDFTYCAEFQPFSDGSDGKKYKGKSLSTPVACP